MLITQLILKTIASALSTTITRHRIITLARSILNSSTTATAAVVPAAPSCPIAIDGLAVFWGFMNAYTGEALFVSSTGCSVERRSFFGFTEGRVVNGSAPELNTRVDCSEHLAGFVVSTEIKSALLVHGVEFTGVF